MSNEITIENARTNTARIFSEYEKEVAASAKEIDSSVKELEKLGVKDPLNNLKELEKDKSKKKLVESIKKAQQDADNAAFDLQTNLAILTKMPESPPDAVVDFLKWLKEAIDSRSVKLSKYAKLKLQVSPNKKKTGIQEVGLEFTWNFKKF